MEEQPMADYTAKHLKDMQAGFGGGFVKVRAELGVSSFGVQVIRMPAGYADYPEHDHAGDGQEEVYTTLTGSGSIEIEGDRLELEPGVFVRVASGTKRKVHAGPEGIEMLIIGACPGKTYEVNPVTELEPAA
jgi:quercetin dioxygenase-like cupin family protein